MMIKFMQCFLIALAFIFLATSSHGQDHSPALPQSIAPLMTQPYMNVFRRFKTDAKAMYTFYGKVLGFKQLMTFHVGGGTSVARFQVGDSQLKLTGVVPNRSYYRGGVADATGVRLLTFFFPDRHALEERFKAQGLPVPNFIPIAGTNRSHALLRDPDGQWVELVILPGADASACGRIEIGLVVSNLARSRAFYHDFVGLKELPPEEDPFFHTKKYPFRHGSTIVNLFCFGPGLPADTGSGGIQYVVSNAKAVEKLAKARHIAIEQPLRKLAGFSLETIWLDDPDGITNYFAQVGVKAK